MSWRPENWEDIKSKIAQSIEYEPSLSYEDRIFEFGADAVLEALRNTGYPINIDSSYAGGKWSKIVVIPDD